MLKDILKRAVGEAMSGRRHGYGYEKPFKKKKRYGYGYDDRYDRGYRHDDRYDRGYRDGGYRGYGGSYGRSGGIKGMLMSAVMSWLRRR